MNFLYLRHQASQLCVGIMASMLVFTAGAEPVFAATLTTVASGKWEDPTVWDLGVVPDGSPTKSAQVIVDGFEITLDTASFAYFGANNALNSGSTGEYRYQTTRVGHLGSSATATLNLDFGDANVIRMTNSGLSYVGSDTGSNGTVNMISGTFTNETKLLAIAEKAGSTGLLNITGGFYTVNREGGGNSVNLGAIAGSDGKIAISGGSFLTRGGLTLGVGGEFEVLGSGATEIGIGSKGSVDGRWIQSGLLSLGVDASGIMPILVDDWDDNGTGGNAAFLSGSLLNPYDLGGASAGVWHTVMTIEGPIVDLGLALTPAASSAGWEHRFDGGSLQVMLAVPEPGSLALLAIGLGCVMYRKR